MELNILLLGILLICELCSSQVPCRRTDGSRGNCMSIQRCFDSGGEIEPAGSVALCADLITDFNDIIVCCRPSPSTIAKQQCISWQSTCTIRQFLVANGDDAYPGEFPYMVSIQENSLSGSKHICGAVLISDEFILTAAHCLRDYVQSRFRLILGAYDINRGRTSAQMKSITRILIHPKYDSRTAYNDIALLKIEKVTFNENVRPVCLPFERKNNFPGDLIVTGWGRTSSTGTGSDVLQKGKLRQVPMNKCKIERGTDAFKYPYGLARDVMCAFGQNVDACQGDSGGPLLAPGSSTCHNSVLGIVSTGFACPSNIPSQYTRVDQYLRWIVHEAFESYLDPR